MTSHDQVRLARAALACLIEPGDHVLHELVVSCGPIGALEAITTGDANPALVETAASRLPGGEPTKLAESILARTVRLGLLPIFGSAAHGYSFSLTGVSPGLHRIDVYALDTKTGTATEIGKPATLNVNQAPTGALQGLNRTTLAGWAYDPDSGPMPIAIRYSIDANAPVLASANVSRPDLVPRLGSDLHGFRVALPPLAAGRAAGVAAAAGLPAAALIRAAIWPDCGAVAVRLGATPLADRM